ncbi:S-layer homology domain-containing protein [Thermaerobacillus caldiproteolyticus]|uniref:S-layer homology domain-containing protein n=1 Tax=Thermaerobacillus caldiproteolyticus TaxID=247480 RepID=UPI00188B4499|nr:S-layer homology domain-containing protein [Anoxybacillus caldiproteolyticus]QPA30760.1 S-layer homology domain-containing protein [Anoxybacillus caldiproteolyticus]
MRKYAVIFLFFVMFLFGGKAADAHVVDLTNKAQAQSSYEDFYPLIARYKGASGVTIESYSTKWRTTAQLKALEAELLANKHGPELSLLGKIMIFPDYPAGENVLGQYFAEYQIGKTLTLLPNRIIHLYGGNDFTTVEQMATTLAHEYGHHFTYYYLINKEQLQPSDWLRSKYAAARELFRYPSVHVNASGAYEWSLPEILAEDYVQLFGSSLALKGHMQMNAALPTPFELPSEEAYWHDQLGSDYVVQSPLSLLLTGYSPNSLNASYYNLRLYLYSPKTSAYVNAQDGNGRYASVYLDTFSSGVSEKWYDPSKLSDDVSWLFQKDWNDSVLFRAVQHAQKGFNRGSTTLKVNYGNIASSVSTRPLFPDIDDEEMKKAVQLLYERGVVTGYSDGTFHPSEKLLRRHAARMLVKELGLTLPEGYKVKATDIKAGDVGYEDMAIAEAYGLFGQGGKLRPNEYMTRAQMAAVLVRAYANVYKKPTTNRSFIDVLPSFWAYDAINTLADNSITIANPFHPNDTVTRGQLALFLKRTLDKKEQ